MSCTCFGLRSATRRVTQHYDRHLRPAGLKVTQYSLLSCLEVGQDFTVTALARMLNSERTTVSRNLALLVRRGHVVVNDGPDARSRAVRLTRRGAEAYAAAIPLWRAAQREMRERWGESDLAKLHELLRKAL